MKKEKYIEINSEDLIYLLNTFEFMKFYIYNMFRKALLPYLDIKNNSSVDYNCLWIEPKLNCYVDGRMKYNKKETLNFFKADYKVNYAYQLLLKTHKNSSFFVYADDIKQKKKIFLYDNIHGGVGVSLYEDEIVYDRTDIEMLHFNLSKFGPLDKNRTLKVKNYSCLYTLIDVLEDFYNTIIIKDIENEQFLNNVKEIRGFGLPTPAFFNKEKIKSILNHRNDTNKINILFDNSGKVLDKYLNTPLENYDFSSINFDNKNISNMKIRNNPTIKINFNKIKKDISNCDFSGYDLSKVTLRDFNIKDTDLRNTSATIDLATCIISKEGKMNPGTLFDENNTFLFLDEKLTKKQVEELKIKVYKKEK